MLKYRRVGLDVLTQSFEISASCDTSSIPLVACSFLGGHVTNEAKVLDVQGANGDNVPIKGDKDTTLPRVNL